MVVAISTTKIQALKQPETVRQNRKEEPSKTKIISFPSERNRSEKEKQASQVEIERVIQAMDRYVKSNQRDLEIQVHKGTGNIMVKVISKEDGKVIREVPSEELLNLAAKMEKMVGGLLDMNA